MCYKAKTSVGTTTVSSTPITPAPLANTVTDDGIVFGDGTETSNTGTKALTNNLDTSDNSDNSSTDTNTTKKVSAITSTNSI